MCWGMTMILLSMHRKKKVREFPVPSRDVTTKLSLGGNNDVITELFLPRGSLVSDIPAGEGKLANLFLRCVLFAHHSILVFTYKNYITIVISGWFLCFSGLITIPYVELCFLSG